MLRDTAGEEGATKDFLSLPKKVLVTLNHFICSFFSTARRTNQEAPPLLSGFWVRRRSRRRGLRNSLRSDSPRPFSSVSLASSPPDKGGIGCSCILTPSPFGHSPYIVARHRGRGLKSGLFPYAVFVPRHAAGHGKGRRGVNLLLCVLRSKI